MTKTRQKTSKNKLTGITLLCTTRFFFATKTISIPISNFFCTTRNQNHEIDYTQQIQKPKSKSVLINEKPKILSERTKNYQCFQQNKTTTNRQFTRS